MISRLRAFCRSAFSSAVTGDVARSSRSMARRMFVFSRGGIWWKLQAAAIISFHNAYGKQVPFALTAYRRRRRIGWNEKKIREVVEHYENQTDDEAVAEDEAAFRAP